MIATKTREESQIEFGMVKKEWGRGAFSFYCPPPDPPPCQKNDAKALQGDFKNPSFAII